MTTEWHDYGTYLIPGGLKREGYSFWNPEVRFNTATVRWELKDVIPNLPSNKELTYEIIFTDPEKQKVIEFAELYCHNRHWWIPKKEKEPVLVSKHQPYWYEINKHQFVLYSLRNRRNIGGWQPELKFNQTRNIWELFEITVTSGNPIVIYSSAVFQDVKVFAQSFFRNNGMWPREEEKEEEVSNTDRPKATLSKMNEIFETAIVNALLNPPQIQDSQALLLLCD